MVKGLAAGAANLLLACQLGAAWPGASTIVAAAGLGFVSVGVSLVLFVIALRHMGTARTGASFSVAPFFGAVLAVLVLREPVTVPLLAAGALMALGVWLHLTERHGHLHVHEAIEHTHEHAHDLHHQHVHADGVAIALRHSHQHAHPVIAHSHGHYPDAHHRHTH